MKIHYRNLHQPTNLPWQDAFRKQGELSLGPITSGEFPKQIDHLHLGGSCKGRHSLTGNPITVTDIKTIQASTGCSVSCFYGDAWLHRFQFHRHLLDAHIPKLKVYSAALYDTPVWRPEVIWVAHPTDERIFQLVTHKKNSTVLFAGHITPYRAQIIKRLLYAGIPVHIVGTGGNIAQTFGKHLVELSKNYTISIGIAYDELRPKVRYFSSRLPNALAMGLIYIETAFDLKAVFESNELIQWYDVPDLITKIKYFQNNISEGYAITMRGRKKVLDNWTFTKLAQRFIKEGNYTHGH